MSDTEYNDGSFDPTDFDCGVTSYILFRIHNDPGEEPDSKSDSVGERCLADWRSNILRSKRNNTLSEDREAILTFIKFAFPVPRGEAFNDTFKASFAALLKWKVDNGVDNHALVPHDAIVDGIKLGVWIKRVRKLKLKHDKGQNTCLMAYHIRQLDAAGMVWGGVHDVKWMMNFDALQQFFNANGHSNVPRTDPDLGNWVNNQKKKYRESTLSADQVEKLDSVNFSA